MSATVNNKSCIRPRMFSTRGTERIDHASDITVKKVGWKKGAVIVQISPRLSPEYKFTTTLEPEEVKELITYLQSVAV